MTWLDKLEKKFGRYAIHNLMLYIIILYAAGFLLYWINPTFYAEYLSLDAEAILHGQIWRIFTFIIEPPSYSIIWIIFALFLYYMIGQTLEAVWGAFKFNVYFFLGMALHVIAALLVYTIFGIILQLGTTYLNLSLFLIYAVMYPNSEFRLYFIIPIKAKWLGLIDGLFFVWTIAQAFLPAYGGSIYQASAMAAAISILNFLIFALTMNWHGVRSDKRQRDFQKKAKPMHMYPNGAKHRCEICGRTELDDPNLEFRYCSKCKGSHEYCQDHIFNHVHIK